jgi:hypothetical protein
MRWIGVVMVVLAGCTTTNDYAVMVSHRQVGGYNTCFRQCQLVRGSGTNALLGCLKTCPEVYVAAGQDCSKVTYDPMVYWCTTEHNKSFSVVPIVVIIAFVVLFAAVGGAASGATN